MKKAGLYQEIPHTDLFLEGFCTFKFPIGNTILKKVTKVSRGAFFFMQNSNSDQFTA